MVNNKVIKKGLLYNKENLLFNNQKMKLLKFFNKMNKDYFSKYSSLILLNTLNFNFKFLYLFSQQKMEDEKIIKDINIEDKEQSKLDG